MDETEMLRNAPKIEIYKLIIKLEQQEHDGTITKAKLVSYYQYLIDVLEDLYPKIKPYLSMKINQIYRAFELEQLLIKREEYDQDDLDFL